MTKHGFDFDVLVVGSGHAGCEAAFAAARLGMDTGMVTMDVGNIAGMPCNPAIGGPGKAQIVAEIDALGGEMALAADNTAVEMRVLNASKGPAVQSLRAQIDKHAYAAYMGKKLRELGIRIIEGMVAEVLVDQGRVLGVTLGDGSRIRSRTVVLCTGVYLESRIFIGDEIIESGPMGEPNAKGLSSCLAQLGFRLGRFKTGTSPRILKQSIDWDLLVPEKGADKPVAFSFMSVPKTWNKTVCYSTYTDERAHEVIRDNIDRAPLFDGSIRGVGPRYCPSIEDKVMRFPDRKRHQLYLEIESEESDDVYILGLSTSLPEDVQYLMLSTIPGLSRAKITRPGYAIEYDFMVPSQLSITFEVQGVDGLFAAGQINGTSGYEEAAAQGLLAGVNAAMKLRGEEPLVLGRKEAYIGVLLDDLVSTVIEEPYRMLTSRAEHRLYLRHSNADMRLTPAGRRVGLVSDERWRAYCRKAELMEKGRAMLEAKVSGKAIKDWLRSPGKYIDDFFDQVPGLRGLPQEVLSEIEIEAKYAGFIERQDREARRLERYLDKRLPEGIDWRKVRSLSRETIDKLVRYRQATIAKALSVGVSPSDSMVILEMMLSGRLGPRAAGGNEGEDRGRSTPGGNAGGGDRGQAGS